MAFLGKTGLILSAGMLLAGGILFGIGASNGGLEQVRVMAENGELSIGNRNFDRHRHTREWATTYVIAEEPRPITEAEVVDCYREGEVTQVLYAGDGYMAEEGWEYEEGIVEIAKKDEIEKLVIDWGIDLSIFLIDGGDFQIMQDCSSYNYKLDGSTLYISQDKNFGDGCVLFIPRSWVGKEIDISVGAGTVYSEALYADKIDISVGTGYMECGGSVTADQLEIEIGSGSLNLSGFYVKDAEVKIGLGMAQIGYGTITGNLKVDCGMGGMVMYLTGKESDHNYKVSSAGGLNIGSYSHYGFNTDYEINNHTSSDFEIKCGLGSIDICFE